MIVRQFKELISFSRNAFFKDMNKESELTKEILEKIGKHNINISDLPIIGLELLLEKYADNIT